jgi:hypothetical protein
MDREYARSSFVDKDLSILLTHHNSEKKRCRKTSTDHKSADK